MKNRLFYITLVVFFITLAITGYLYYVLSLTTVAEFDNKLVDSRNEVITQIDVVSSTLNTAEDADTIDQQIQLLVEKNEKMRQDFKSAKQPDKNGDEIVRINQAFLDKTDEIVLVAEQYRVSFSQDDIDPVEKITEYNTKVNELSSIIEETKTILDNNKESLLQSPF